MRRLAFLSRLPLPRLIRVRLTLWYTCLVALVLAIFVGTVFAAFSQYQQSADDYTALLTQTFDQQARVELSPAYFRTNGVRADGAYIQLQLKDPNAPTKSGYTMEFFDLSGKPLPDQPPNPRARYGRGQEGATNRGDARQDRCHPGQRVALHHRPPLIRWRQRDRADRRADLATLAPDHYPQAHPCLRRGGAAAYRGGWRLAIGSPRARAG